MIVIVIVFSIAVTIVIILSMPDGLISLAPWLAPGSCLAPADHAPDQQPPPGDQPNKAEATAECMILLK